MKVNILNFKMIIQNLIWGLQLFLMFAIIFCFSLLFKQNNYQINNDTDIFVTTSDTQYINIPIFNTIYISEHNQTFTLSNLEGNSKNIKYTIYNENNEKIYETNYIPPNFQVEVNLYDLLNNGTNNLNFQTEDFVQYNINVVVDK